MCSSPRSRRSVAATLPDWLPGCLLAPVRDAIVHLLRADLERSHLRCRRLVSDAQLPTRRLRRNVVRRGGEVEHLALLLCRRRSHFTRCCHAPPTIHGVNRLRAGVGPRSRRLSALARLIVLLPALMRCPQSDSNRHWADFKNVRPAFRRATATCGFALCMCPETFCAWGIDDGSGTVPVAPSSAQDALVLPPVAGVRPG